MPPYKYMACVRICYQQTSIVYYFIFLYVVVMMASFEPSEEKARRLRLLSLIIEGGALVLRHQFDKKFPPSRLRSDLLNVRRRINVLIQKRVIRKDQAEKLYPLLHDPCSSTFDITLLTCLLRNICGLARPWDPVWSGVPPSHDTSVEADITRLRNYRNEVKCRNARIIT